MYVYATLNNNGCQISTFILVYFFSNVMWLFSEDRKGKQDISVLSILKPAVVGLHFKCNFR